MTLKEILDKVEFADIVNPLIERDPQCADKLYSLKEAFDLLRMMTPQPSDGTKIDVEMTDYEDGNPPCLSAHYNGQEDWEIMLSREVVISGECRHLPDSAIAAILLWEITYWGFSLEEQRFLHSREHLEGNPYVARLARLEQRHHDINCKHREDIGKMTFLMKDFSDLFYEPKRNGPKRHREKRLTIQIAKQEKLANRWDLSKTLTSQHHINGETAVKLHEEIMNGNSFCYYYLQSRTPNGNDGEYLAELIRDYFPPKTGSKSIVLVRGAGKKLDDNAEWIWSAFCSFLKLPHSKYIVSPVEGMTNVHVDILVFE